MFGFARPAWILAGLLLAMPARADVDDDPVSAPATGPLPSVRWYTLETPHFDLHYYPAERAFAEHAARVAERAYRLVTRYLNWRPAGRVSITLNDHTDYADGFASSIPYNYIYAYGAPPDSLDELSDFDDYVGLLITHELTHVVHLDTILSWCPRLIDTVFGKIYAPNLSQPTWFIEGLAVLLESRHTTAGRLRSSFYNMHLRVPFLEGHVFGLDAVSNRPLAFPHGTVPYLYGSSMLRYLEDRYGPEKLREISHRYGDECIAGGLNRVTARAVGRGYAEIAGDGLWEDWKRSMSHRYALEAEEASRRGLTTARRLTTDAPGPRGEGPGPRFFPDGTLLYHRASLDASPAYVRLDPVSGTRSQIVDIHGAGRGSPTPDGRGLVFQQLNFLPLAWRISGSAQVAWNDLFYLDLRSKAVHPLTRGYRAHEPDVSPDGKEIVCAVGATGVRQLAVVPIGGGVPRVLLPGTPGFVYTPVFSPDAKLIAYSRWKPGGFRDIHLYDVAAGTDRPLSVDRAMDVDPRFTPDGRYLLFASDRTGIYDIFAYELATGRLQQVTNVVSGAFQPAVSPDGSKLVYTGFSSEGFDLYEMPFDPAAFLPAQPYANARLDAPTDPDRDSDSPDAAPEDAAAPPLVTRTKTYAPWRYMYPRKWDLRVLPNPLGSGESAYLATTLSDPVGNHFVSASLLLPSEFDPSAAVYYAYNRLWPSFAVSARRAAQDVGGFILGGVDTRYRQHVYGASASIGLPLRRTAASFSNVSFGYDYTAYGLVGNIPAADPTAPITVRPEHGPDTDIYVYWDFNNVHAWPYSVSGQEGRALALYLRISDPALGGRFRTTELSWSWSEYFTPPWAKLHALAMSLNGGIGIGDKRQLFVIGGFVEQDLLRAIFLNRRAQGLFLRGYPANAFGGDTYNLLSTEYRAPLVWIERGYRTFPLYLRRIWGSVFVDAGNAYFGQFRPSDIKVGAGAEARLQFNIAHYLETELKLGFAHGFHASGGNQLYFVAATSF